MSSPSSTSTTATPTIRYSRSALLCRKPRHRNFELAIPSSMKMMSRITASFDSFSTIHMGYWLTECMFGNPGINGCFFRRSVFEKVGLFNNDFHICADRDFVTRASLAESQSISLNMPTLFYRSHSGSQTINRARSISCGSPTNCSAWRRCSSNPAAATPGYMHLARAWHAFEGARLALVQIRSGQLANAAKLFVGCSLRNPLWPLYLIRAMYLRRIVRRHYRGGWNADVPTVAEVADGLRRC